MRFARRISFALLVLFTGAHAIGADATSPSAAPSAPLSAIQQLIEQTGIKPAETAMRDMPGWRRPTKILVRDVGIPTDDLETAMAGIDIVVVRSEEEALENVDGAAAIIGSCSDRLISAASDAIWVQIFYAGAERCLQTARIADGSVVLTNMQKMASPVIAEHVIALTLGLARALPQYAKAMADGRWSDPSRIAGNMQSLAGKTMLVAGLGGIGTEVARRAAALDMRVVGTRRSSRVGPDFVDYVGLADELDTLAAQADVIVNSLPLTPETTGLFDAALFSKVKRGAIFINVGRGKTVVTADLVAALESGQLAGAALDVTDPEPLPADHALWRMENVIITPHVAASGSNRQRQMTLVLENLKRFRDGDALLNVVDPTLGY